MEPQREVFVQKLVQSEIVESEPKGNLTASNIDESTATTSLSNLKLTDLNIDCLQHIFTLLSLKNLLNVADMSKQLKPAVEKVYRFRYGEKIQKIFLGIGAPPNETPDYIEIFDLKTALQLLRHFGHLVRKLKVTFNEKVKNCEKVYRYINEYCNAHLTEIVFTSNFVDGNRCDTGLSGDLMQKPFLNLEKVEFDIIFVGKEITQFNRWFPKMRILIMKAILPHPECMEMHFISLEHLDIAQCTKSDSMEMVLRLNPQLRILKLNCDYSGRMIKAANKYLKNLEHLGVFWLAKGDIQRTKEVEIISSINGNDIYFNHLKKLDIYTYKIEWDDETIYRCPKIPITFGPITELRVWTPWNLGDEFMEFLIRHSSITNMIVSAGDVMDVSYLATLPSLQNIIFDNIEIPVQDAEQIMDKIPSLQMLGYGSFSNISDKNCRTNIGTCEVEDLENGGNFTVSILTQGNL